MVAWPQIGLVQESGWHCVYLFCGGGFSRIFIDDERNVKVLFVLQYQGSRQLYKGFACKSSSKDDDKHLDVCGGIVSNEDVIKVY